MHAAMRTLLLTLLLACAAHGLVRAQAPKPRAKIRHEVLTLPLAQGAVEVHHFAIPLAKIQLAYVDLKYQTPLIEALGEHDLVLNGGYWGYRGQRRVLEGLLIVNDQQLSPAHPQGGVLVVRDGTARVVRGEQFSAAADTALALQCSPRLVDGGKQIPKLETSKRAARTALCVGADRGVLSAYLTEAAITLPELAQLLLKQGCREALNLDGGPSTAAVARAPQGQIAIGHGRALPYGIGFRAR